MTTSHLDISKLSSIPNIKLLLLKAALKQLSYGSQKSSEVLLPSNKFYFDGFELNEPKSRLYHQVNGWDLESGFVHPCYLHSLAFPLHIMLLLLPEFPFPLLGLVHVNNQIRQVRPIMNNEELTVSSRFGELELHPKGWLFSIKVEFHCGFELVWQSISTNLFRTNHGYDVDPTAANSIATFIDPKNINWQLSANLGRRYATVSGDFNPIHLSKWSAKLFGFKQHIIHGMWTKAYCISALQKISPSLFFEAFEVNTTFKQPLYLPSQVKMVIQAFESDSTPDELQFKVLGSEAKNEQQLLHLVGNIRVI
jgi:acyl dehydratase